MRRRWFTGSWVVFFVINDNELNDSEDVENKTNPTETPAPPSRDHASVPRTTRERERSTIVLEVISAPQTRGRQLEFIWLPSRGSHIAVARPDRAEAQLGGAPHRSHSDLLPLKTGVQ